MTLPFSSRRTPRFEESEDSVTEPLISPDLEMNSSDKSQNLSSFFSSRQNIYSVYVLLLFLITYLLNQLDRYMLAIVTKPLAQASIFSLLFFTNFWLTRYFFIRRFIMGILLAWPTTQPLFKPHNVSVKNWLMNPGTHYYLLIKENTLILIHFFFKLCSICVQWYSFWRL